MYKLIAIDIDGTLLNLYGDITQENKEAIKNAISQGVLVVLCSGRISTAIKNIANDIGASKYLISGNGAVVLDMQKNEEIYKNYLSKEKVLEIINLCEENSIFYNIYTTDTIITKSLNYNLLFYNHENKKNLPDKKTDMNITENIPKYIEEYDKDDFLKITICDSDQIIFSRIINILKKQKHIDILDVEHMSRKLIKSGTEEIELSYFYTEITNEEVNKWSAIEFLINKLNIKKEEVIAIGDNINDIEMIKNAGLGIAMENSSQEVKKFAKEITKNNNQSGVAETINKYIKS